MKKLLIIAGCMAVASAVLAQGTLNFANLGGGANAPILNAAGVKIAGGTGYVADLFYSTDTAAATSSLTPAGFNHDFSAAAAGYFLAGSQAIANVGGVQIEAQVRVWNTTVPGVSGAASYNQASTLGGGEWGVSKSFLITLAIPPTPAPGMAGLGTSGFQLTLNQVPEPSTFALAGLGAAALLIFRRRK